MMEAFKLFLQNPVVRAALLQRLGLAASPLSMPLLSVDAPAGVEAAAQMLFLHPPAPIMPDEVAAVKAAVTEQSTKRKQCKGAAGNGRAAAKGAMRAADKGRSAAGKGRAAAKRAVRPSLWRASPRDAGVTGQKKQRWVDGDSNCSCMGRRTRFVHSHGHCGGEAVEPDMSVTKTQ